MYFEDKISVFKVAISERRVLGTSQRMKNGSKNTTTTQKFSSIINMSKSAIEVTGMSPYR